MLECGALRVLVALLIATHGGGGVDGMQPLLGGQLSWRVDRGFSELGVRRVSLTLTTVFSKAPDCYYTIGSGPVCDPHPACASDDAACAAAENHGVLCVAQLVPEQNRLVSRFWVNDGQCVHDLNAAGAARADGGIGVAREMAGRWNNFTVRSVHDDPDGIPSRRELSRTPAVMGELRHEVLVDDEASALLAWLAPRRGYSNLASAEGVLLPQCTDNTSALEPCAENVHDSASPPAFGFVKLGGAGGSGFPRSTVPLGPFSESDRYWQDFPAVVTNGSAFALSASSPLLETFVQLCSIGGVVSCDTKPLPNLNSPVAPFPLVLEVPITPMTRHVTMGSANAPGLAFSGAAVDGTSGYVAPHPPVPFKSFDLDGDLVTQYSPYSSGTILAAEPRQGFRAECYAGAVAGAVWPVARCSGGGHAGRACVTDSECGMSSTCEPTWSGCGVFSDHDSNPYTAEGNVIKFDFSFGTTATPRRFRQNVLLTVDMPNGKPAWSEGAASVQTLFSAYACDAGNNNQPPVFVAGPQSRETRVLTDVRCAAGASCRAALHARDFALDASGAPTAAESGDRVRIEQVTLGAALGDAGDHLEHLRGGACEGLGGADCLFSLEVGAPGEVHVRCFAAVDVHDAGAAPTARSCRSLPLCLKFRVVGATAAGIAAGMQAPRAVVRPAVVHTESASIALSWQTLPSVVVGARVQFMAGNGSAPSVVEMPLLPADSEGVVVPLSLVLGHGVLPGDTVAFRLELLADSGVREVGLWSNAVRVLTGPAVFVGSDLYGASWAGNVLRWHRFDLAGGADEFMTQPASPVVQGAAAIDSTREQAYAVVAAPGGGQDAQLQLLTVALATGQEVARVDLATSGRALWNVKYDEARGLLVAVGVSGSSFSVLAFRVRDGSAAFDVALPGSARFGVSTLDRDRALYYFVDETGLVRGFDVSAQQLLPGGVVASESGTGQIILSIAFDNRGQSLHMLVGAWPQEEGSPVILVQRTVTGEVNRTVTSLVGADVEFGTFAFDFARGRIVAHARPALGGASLTNGSLAVYDVGNNETVRLSEGAPMHVIFLSFVEDREPRIEAVEPGTVIPHGQQTLTFTGANFGAVDLSPRISLDSFGCAHTAWLSDRQIACTLQLDLNDAKIGIALTARLGVLERRVDAEGAIVLASHVHAVGQPIAVRTLEATPSLTITGRGLRPPWDVYRAVLAATGGERAVSGPPISANETHLTFEVPFWTHRATDAGVLLAHGGALTPLPQHPAPASSSPFGAQTVQFLESWGEASLTQASAAGGAVVTLTGAGFNAEDAGAYECDFGGLASVAADSVSTREVVCTVPVWTRAATSVPLMLRRRGATLPRLSRTESDPLAVGFTFVTVWSSYAPLFASIDTSETVTLYGNGYNVSATYRCEFTALDGSGFTRDVQATAVTHSALQCASPVPGGGGAALRLELRLYSPDGGLLGVEPFSLVRPGVSADAVGAAGGAVLSIASFGVGGLGGAPPLYSCEFSSEFSDASVRTEPQYATEQNLVECTAPAWPAAAGTVQIRVWSVNASQYITARFDIAVFPEVLNMTGNGASVRTGLPTTYDVSGAGFSSTRLYELVFVSTTSSDQLTVLCDVVSSTLLKCRDAVWMHPEATTTAAVLEDGGEVQNRGALRLGARFTSHWTGVIFSQGPGEVLASGDLVTVTGFGFPANASDFTCVLTLGNTTVASPAQPVAVGLVNITCELRPWPAASGEAVFSLHERGVPVERDGDGPLRVRILTQVNSIYPELGSSFGGGTPVQIFGHGFDSSRSYACVYARVGSGNLSRVSVDAEFLSSDELLCPVPEWQFPKGRSDVHLSEDGEDVRYSRRNFHFVHALSGAHSPTSALIFPPALIEVDGRGWSQDPSEYTCVFVSLGANASGCDGPPLGARYAVTQATAITTTELFCPAPAWPYRAETVDMTVCHEGESVPALNTMEYTFLSRALAVEPWFGQASSAITNVSGVGFDVDREMPSYICTTIPRGLNSTLGRAFPHPEDATKQMVTCNLPPWKDPPLDGIDIQLRVVDTLLNVVFNGSFLFHFDRDGETPTQIIPSTGVATGAETVNITGNHFTPLFTYRFVFQRGDDEIISEPATVLSSTVLQGRTPRWVASSGPVTMWVTRDGTRLGELGLNFEFTEIITRTVPDSGLVFGSYLTVHGVGFQDDVDWAYQCVLVSLDDTDAPELRSDVTQAKSYTAIECEFPRWDHVAQGFSLKVLNLGRGGTGGNITVPGLPSAEPMRFALKAGWLSASLGRKTNFQGGMEVTVHGAGFDPALRPGYTCVFVDGNSRSCPVKDACVHSNSSDTTLPLAQRDVSIARSTTELVCTVPTWVHENPHAKLWLYAEEEEVEKVYAGQLSTEFVGQPILDRGANAPSKGGELYSLTGQFFGLVDLSPRTRIGFTACRSSEWTSSTALVCKVPRKSGSERTFDMQLTVSPYRVGILTSSFSYDLIRVAKVKRELSVGNGPTLGAVDVTVFGAGFQNSGLTQRARIGGTATDSTLWVSDTAIVSRVSSGVGVANKEVVVTVEADFGSASTLFSYDAPAVGMVRESPLDGALHNAATRGGSSSASVTLQGAGFGMADYSVVGRFGVTAAEITGWMSDSAIPLRSAAGSAGSQRVVVTAGQFWLLGSATEAVSYNLPAVIVSANNQPAAGLHAKLMVGSGFGSNSFTGRVRTGFTGAEATTWGSDSAIFAKGVAGTLGTRNVMITVGARVGSISESYSYNIPTLQNSLAWLDQGVRIAGFNFSEYGVGITISSECLTFVAAQGRKPPRCEEWVDWRVDDHVESVFFRPGSWFMCKDDPAKCKDLTQISPLSPLYLPGTPTWDTVVKHGTKIYGNYPLINSEGTHLVYTTKADYSTGLDAEWADYTVQFTFISFVDDWMGVSFRYKDDDDYYRFEMNNVLKLRRLKKRVGGTVTVLWNDVSFTGFDYVLYTIRVEALGNTIRIFMDEGNDLDGPRSTWTPVCGTPTADPAAGQQCAYEDSSHPEGTFALFSSGSSSLYFMNMQMFRPALHARHGNLPSNGDSMVTISGRSFATSTATPASSIGTTSCQLTTWISDSSLLCKSPQGIMASRHLVVTAGIRGGTMTDSLSYDTPRLSLVSYWNVPTSGNANVTVYGAAASFGISDYTLTSRVMCTGMERSAWISDTTVQCGVAHGIGGTLRVIVTAGLQTGTGTEMMSYTLPVLLESERSNRPTTGGVSVKNVNLKLLGDRIGAEDYTQWVRLGSTSSENTQWQSDDEVLCFSAGGVFGTHRLVVTAGIAVGSITEAATYDAPAPVSSNVTHEHDDDDPTVYTHGITIQTTGIGEVDYTAAVRVGSTACEATSWSSDSSVLCTSPSGVGGTLRAVITAGQRAGTITEMISYDPRPAFAEVGGGGNMPSTGAAEITVTGVDFATSDSSVAMRLGFTATEATEWIADTTIWGKTVAWHRRHTAGGCDGRDRAFRHA